MDRMSSQWNEAVLLWSWKSACLWGAFWEMSLVSWLCLCQKVPLFKLPWYNLSPHYPGRAWPAFAKAETEMASGWWLLLSSGKPEQTPIQILGRLLSNFHPVAQSFWTPGCFVQLWPCSQILMTLLISEPATICQTKNSWLECKARPETSALESFICARLISRWHCHSSFSPKSPSCWRQCTSAHSWVQVAGWCPFDFSLVWSSP